MASYPHNTAASKAKPWPAYFIVRTSGDVVPLIGVDELPIGTDLVGVPRALDLQDTIGMLNLGIQRSSEAFYRITQHEEEDSVADESAPSPKTPERTVTKPKTIEAQSPATPRSSNTTPTRQALRSLPETQICRHWCTHGICKWGQQCRYRHIMPMTLPGLQEIGLNDWPAWYRALNPGYFAAQISVKPHVNQRRRKSTVCSGNGCYRGLHLGLGVTHARAERLKATGKRREAGEAAVAKLRGSPLLVKEAKEGRGEKGEKVCGTVMLERAAVKDARDWEEGSEVYEGKEKVVEKVKVEKTSLLD